MKNLNILFDLLLFPFLFLISLRKLWGRLFITFFLNFALTPLLLQAGSPTCDENTTSHTVEPGIHIIAGTTINGQVSYEKLLIPAEGNITITMTKKNKATTFDIGKGCNLTDIYHGDTKSNLHKVPLFDVTQGQVLYLMYGDDDAKSYTLTINYQVDISHITVEQPSFCYNYYAVQGTPPNDENLSNDDGNITTDSAGDIHINLSIKLLDINYASAKNVVADIIDIPQASYITESVTLKKPGRFYYTEVPDSTLTITNTEINDIKIGTMTKADIFFINYDINPSPPVNFPLNARITYDLPVPVGNTFVLVSGQQSIVQDDIPMCPSPGSGYAPAYSIFNVEHNYLNDVKPIYNLQTQTARRVDDLEIISYKIDALHTKNSVSTFIGIELIDYDETGGFPNACSNPNNAISPRIWIPFFDETAMEEDGKDANITQISFNRAMLQKAISAGVGSDMILGVEGDLMSTPEDFYGVVNKNTAFRVIYSGVGDDEGLITIVPTKQGLRIDNFTDLVQDIKICRQPVINPSAPQNMTELVPVACSNDGNNLTYREIAICMECLYGYDTRFLCSRDNFAIRPESFRIDLKDQLQTDTTQRQDITINNSIATRHQIVAGYDYALEINATSHQNDSATPGYNVSFLPDGSDENRTFRLKQSFSVTVDKTKCNDITDHNRTLRLYNGEVLSNGEKQLDLNSTQVGEYDLTITDKLWTRVDWDNTLMTHHDVVHFLGGDDCDFSNSSVSKESIYNVKSGCIITSDGHTNSDTGAQYTDIPLRVHPYKFDLNSSSYSNPIDPMVGPNTTRNQTFVYIDTPPTMDQNDTNMSYNMSGTFVAAGEDNGTLSNFVSGCYAVDVNMSLNFIYNHGDIPSKIPFLSYSLKDYNNTNSAIIYRPDQTTTSNHFEVVDHDSTTAPLIITQNKNFFVKDMKGSIKMNLGYNFRRTYDQPLNPRYIEFKDFNITHITTPMSPTNIYADLTNDHKIFGDKILDHNVSFLYGRAKPTKFFYEDITVATVTTPVSIVAYCDMNFSACQDRGIQALFAQTNEANWWLSLDHNSIDSDGDVVLLRGSITEGPGSPTVTPASPNTLSINSSIDNNVVVASNGSTLPITVEIDFDTTDATVGQLTNRWLIYNEYDNSVPSPFYKVEFIGVSGWAGHGDTGNVVESNASSKKNRRLGW